jgi:hypothetical protein
MCPRALTPLHTHHCLPFVFTLGGLFRPASISRRSSSERLTPWLAARVSKAAIISSGSRTVINGSVPVAGRPGRRFRITFFVDGTIVSVIR